MVVDSKQGLAMKPLLSACMLLTSLAAAHAFEIRDDRGGQIGRYMETFKSIRANETVRIDGNCFSACTLVLHYVPRHRICTTSEARFGFHAAWIPADDGRPVPSPKGTKALMDRYPPDVLRRIREHGGLKTKMFYVNGSALGIRRCTQEALARSQPTFAVFRNFRSFGSVGGY